MPKSAWWAADELVAELQQDPGAVASVGVGAAGAAVLEMVERAQRPLDDLVRA